MSDLVMCLISKTRGPWKIQIHSRHGSKDHDQKHVHITRPGLSGEYSWNEDGSRHDKHRFPKSGKMIEKAKSIAASELRIPIGTLQFVADVPGGLYVRISQSDGPRRGSRLLLNIYIRLSESCQILEGEHGLIVVVSDQA